MYVANAAVQQMATASAFSPNCHPRRETRCWPSQNISGTPTANSETLKASAAGENCTLSPINHAETSFPKIPSCERKMHGQPCTTELIPHSKCGPYLPLLTTHGPTTGFPGTFASNMAIANSEAAASPPILPLDGCLPIVINTAPNQLDRSNVRRSKRIGRFPAQGQLRSRTHHVQ